MNLYETIKSNLNEAGRTKQPGYINKLRRAGFDRYYFDDWFTFNHDEIKSLFGKYGTKDYKDYDNAINNFASDLLIKLKGKDLKRRSEKNLAKLFEESDADFDVEGLADRLDQLGADMDPYEYADVNGTYQPSEDSYQAMLTALYNNPEAILKDLETYDVIDWEDVIATEYKEVIEDLKKWINIYKSKNESEHSKDYLDGDKVNYFCNEYYKHEDTPHRWTKKEMKDWILDDQEYCKSKGYDCLFTLEHLDNLLDLQHDLYKADKKEGLVENQFAPTDEDWDKQSRLSSEDITWLSNQGHLSKLNELSMRYYASGDIETDERRLSDLATTYFYDKVGIYNDNIDKLCDKWAHDQAVKINESEGSKNKRLSYFEDALVGGGCEIPNELTYKWSKKDVKDWIESVMDKTKGLYSLDKDCVELLWNYQHELYKKARREMRESVQINKYLVTVNLDGKEKTIKTTASSEDQAKKQVCDSLKVPVSVVTKVESKGSIVKETELTPEALVKDAYNHLVSDLGKDPTVEDVFDDLVNNYEQEYFKDDTPEHSLQDVRAIKSILRRLNLSFKESETVGNITYLDSDTILDDLGSDYECVAAMYDELGVNTDEEFFPETIQDDVDNNNLYLRNDNGRTEWVLNKDGKTVVCTGRDSANIPNVYFDNEVVTEAEGESEDSNYKVDTRNLNLTNHGWHNNSDIVYGRIALLPKDKGSKLMPGHYDIIYFCETGDLFIFKLGTDVRTAVDYLYNYGSDDYDWVEWNGRRIQLDNIYDVLNDDKLKDVPQEQRDAIERAVNNAYYNEEPFPLDKVNYN